MSKILEIKDLTFGYDKQNVLENINLVVEKNDFLAIIGPNGGGKSTLLKLILGLLQPKSGDVKLFGTKQNRNNIGYVPQNTNVNIDFPITVLEVVLMGHNSKRKTYFGYSKEDKICAMGALEKVTMDKFANEKIGKLSGGQRQRVMIARSLCSNPDVLILDEPTASIDVKGQKDIYNLLKELNEHITVIVVSHDISVILGYAKKVAHINKNLVYHDISEKTTKIEQKDDEHFCEVEMLQLLGSCRC
ncbi:MAG: metal ABC transporter ATP-binding protein [Campylobacterota bacterium]|nr:metal ABC transporter ATP-binding protein [Campylobacterota bacterium]